MTIPNSRRGRGRSDRSHVCYPVFSSTVSSNQYILVSRLFNTLSEYCFTFTFVYTYANNIYIYEWKGSSCQDAIVLSCVGAYVPRP